MIEKGFPSSLRPTVLASMLVIFAELMLIMLLIPRSWLSSIVDKETTMVEWYMGQEATTWIENHSSQWYDTIVTGNRMEHHARSILLPTDEQRRSSRGMEQIGDSLWFPWVEGRIEAFFSLIEHVLFRAATIASWAPFVPVFLIPAIIDGWVKWRIRQHGFAYPSPLAHRTATALIGYGVLLTVILLFAPLPLPAWLLPGLLLIVLASVPVMVANAQKRL